VPETPIAISVEDVLRIMAGPFAKAEGIGHVEQTKRHAITAEVEKKGIASAFWIAVGVLGLAGVALFKDQPQLAEKVILAVIAFAAGVGVGREWPRRRPGAT
jgi:hypothetical protein